MDKIVYKEDDILICINKIPKNINGKEKFRKLRAYKIGSVFFYPSFHIGGLTNPTIPKDKKTSHHTYRLKYLGKYSISKNKIIKFDISKIIDSIFSGDYGEFSSLVDHDMVNFVSIKSFERENKIKQLLL